MPISRVGTSNSVQGFTLVELMVVVTLLSLVAVFTVPLFSSIGTGDLGYSARRLSGTIKYLFNEAALTGRPHRLVYNLDQHSYRASIVELDGTVNPLLETGQARELSGQVVFRDIQVPGRGTFTSGEVTLHIDPSGWIEESLVHLEDSSQRQMTLQVLPLTGLTEVYDGYKILK